MTLCKKARVPMSENEQFLKPTRSIIDDSLYKQYVELQFKQIKEWKQRRKEKMDVSVSVKRKEKSKTEKQSQGSINTKLDSMIRWM